jgi:hypothetical protein
LKSITALCVVGIPPCVCTETAKSCLPF